MQFRLGMIIVNSYDGIPFLVNEPRLKGIYERFEKGWNLSHLNVYSSIFVFDEGKDNV